jgi:hypothetical protein
MKYHVEGFTANNEMLKMLHHHILGPGWPDKKRELVKKLEEAGVLDPETGFIVELSPYFEQMLDRGYLSDDYAEYVAIEVDAESPEAAAAGKRWVYKPYIVASDQAEYQHIEGSPTP